MLAELVLGAFLSRPDRLEHVSIGAVIHTADTQHILAGLQRLGLAQFVVVEGGVLSQHARGQDEGNQQSDKRAHKLHTSFFSNLPVDD